eukprot:jgi/Psemu1/54544/gm1.54544_g
MVDRHRNFEDINDVQQDTEANKRSDRHIHIDDKTTSFFAWTIFCKGICHSKKIGNDIQESLLASPRGSKGKINNNKSTSTIIGVHV